MFGEIHPVMMGTYVGGCFPDMVQRRLYESKPDLEELRSKLEEEAKKVLPTFNARGKLVEEKDSGNILNFLF